MERLFISGGKPYELVKSKSRGNKPIFRFDDKGRAILDRWALSQLEIRTLIALKYVVSDKPFEDIKPEEPKVEEVKPVEVKAEEPKVEPVEEPKKTIPTNRRELVAYAKALISEGKISAISLNGKTENIIEHIKKEMK